MISKIRTKKNHKIITKDHNGKRNGFLLPIYNIHDDFFEDGKEPKQVYLTTIKKGCLKGPHLHYIRSGYFTCIRGNVKIVLKTKFGYEEYFTGDNFEYLSIEIPNGVPALMFNIGNIEAFVLNMPNPAWTPEMHDEHTADFSDYLNETKMV